MKKIFFLLFICCFFSCKEEAIPVDSLYFENPQPLGDAELKTFPSVYLGIYKDADSVFIQIDKNRITKYTFAKSKIHKTELDSLGKEFEMVNGKLINKKDNLVFDVRKVGDSLELSSKNSDTIFKFSEVQKLKRIKGNLVLNQKEEDYWYVKVLSLNKNQLKFRYFSMDDLPAIDSIVSKKPTVIDSVSRLINPSRREFKKILGKKLSTEIIYNKI